MKKSFLFILLIISLISSCEDKNNNLPSFELLSPEATGIDFVNQLQEDDSLNIIEFDYMYNGGGVAAGDFNNDGLTDVFFSGNKVSSRLYLNKGNMKFQDITSEAGLNTDQWTEGVTLVDINHDGLLDIYVSSSSNYSNKSSSNLLFVNNGISGAGIPSFTEKAAEYGLNDSGYNTQAVFFDFDKDGHLDLYVLSNAVEGFSRNVPRPRQTTGKGKSTDKLYKNNGNGTFTNISNEAGISVEGYGLGVVVSDINKDGWPDIYVSNDFVTNDLLYINNGDGTFTNKISEMLKHQSLYGMGSDVADFNNDGLVDIVVVDMMPDKNLRQKSMFSNINYDLYELNLRLEYEPQFIRNTLQLNNGNGTFSEIGQLSGVYKTDWSWAPLFADFDNDGFKDLFISNGYGKDITDMDFVAYRSSLITFGTPESKKMKVREEINKMINVKIPNFMFKNNGNLVFEDISTDWGFTQPSLSNGVAYADFDNDGDLDLIINNINDKAFLYQNNADKIAEKTGRANNFLKVVFKGDSINTQGIGSKISLKYKDKEQRTKQQYYEHFLTRGYKSTVDHTAHFGLGDLDNVDTLEVLWPDGSFERLLQVKTNQTLVLSHKEANPTLPSDVVPGQTLAEPKLFSEVSKSLGVDYLHQSEDVVDFKVQPLLPHKHSENGPGLAVGDVNGDGLDDYYVGGSPGYPGKLFTQTTDGMFSERTVVENQDYDDMGALFLDVENDGDLDLYIVSGGSRFKEGSEYYQDRLYINDGIGNFTMSIGALPEMATSGSVVVAADYDKDGDLDLFVGGRVVPGKYPLSPKSYILRNVGGKFEDATTEVFDNEGLLGLVTSAIWSDFDQDGTVDLIVTGEWMPLTFFKNSKKFNGKHELINYTGKLGLEGTSGWWNSIAAGDFDHDGDMDYVAGNLGLNSKYKASAEQPVSLYAKDFDNNGSIDPVMFHDLEGEQYPVHPRDALIDQMSYMKGRFPSYAYYGKTNFENFFQADELDGAQVFQVNEFSSSYINNNGDGSFSLSPLPVEAQFSTVFGIVPKDWNGDGNYDLLLIGNSYATETLTGRYDASIGNFLSGDGSGNFKNISATHSGFMVDGNAKAMAELTIGNKSYIIVSQQKDSLKMFTISNQDQDLLQVLSLENNDHKAEFFLTDGKKITKEFYYGGSYLAQDSRKLILDPQVERVVIYDFAGNKRQITLSEKTISSKGI